MKQEATNTFGEGIIMDLNPLTTPNNVLTSALNATMITYNGNEFVLQNDMGKLPIYLQAMFQLELKNMEE